MYILYMFLKLPLVISQLTCMFELQLHQTGDGPGADIYLFIIMKLYMRYKNNEKLTPCIRHTRHCYVDLTRTEDVQWCVTQYLTIIICNELPHFGIVLVRSTFVYQEFCTDSGLASWLEKTALF